MNPSCANLLTEIINLSDFRSASLTFEAVPGDRSSTVNLHLKNREECFLSEYFKDVWLRDGDFGELPADPHQYIFTISEIEGELEKALRWQRDCHKLTCFLLHIARNKLRLSLASTLMDYSFRAEEILAGSPTYPDPEILLSHLNVWLLNSIITDQDAEAANAKMVVCLTYLKRNPSWPSLHGHVSELVGTYNKLPIQKGWFTTDYLTKLISEEGYGLPPQRHP